jgi:hypothetical protein
MFVVEAFIEKDALMTVETMDCCVSADASVDSAASSAPHPPSTAKSKKMN